MIHLINASVPTCLLDESLHLPFDPEDPLNPVTKIDLTVADGRISRVAPAGTIPAEETGAPGLTHDLDGEILTTRFVDPHIHLDKAHTWNRAPNLSGTFGEAIEVLGKDKVNWSTEDVFHRADFALSCAYAHGTTAVRTHIDTGLSWSERSYEAIQSLRRKWRGKLEIQSVSLCGIEQYSEKEGDRLADLPLQYGSSSIGGMPVMNPDLPSQLDRLLQLAAERKTGIDLHVDESNDPEARCLLAVAEAVLRNEFPYPVVCGHCCSLTLQPETVQKETIAKVKEAGVHIISLPLCNLYLQDRRPSSSFHRTPRWRGITLIREFLSAGVPVACGSDNVRDAFYAYGDLDAFEVYLTSMRIAHLEAHLSESLKIITRSPAGMMQLKEAHSIATGAPARFIHFNASSFSEWLSRPSVERRLFEGSEWIEPTVPAWSDLT